MIERLRTNGGRRLVGVFLALLIEALLILLLLSLGIEDGPGDGAGDVTVVNFEANEASKDVPETPEADSEDTADPVPTPQQPAEQPPQPPVPTEAIAQSPPRAVIPTPFRLPPSAERPPVRPVTPKTPAYGPPATGGRSSGDTPRVGTAPNGEPLYAAAWYREPRDDELRGFLSTASGPGWGLIACRTAPDYRVEDCVALDEYPNGAQINRAVLAAAWQFKVRPPRIGGRSLVGSWVRIRIDYSIARP